MDLIDAIQTDREPEIGMFTGLTLTEMNEAIYASSLTGQRMQWPLDRSCLAPFLLGAAVTRKLNQLLPNTYWYHLHSRTSGEDLPILVLGDANYWNGNTVHGRLHTSYSDVVFKSCFESTGVPNTTDAE